ncbi:MAG: esterase [Flavobacteriaceae bacterium]|nr:esterase [Flavobacteriaceae bacterium]
MKRALLTCCLLITFTISSQTKGNPITIGDNYTISSKILNQDREIQIYLPNSYASSKQSYPVLYILDGQWFFANGVSIQKSLRTPGAIPEMIVVGIKNSNPLRRTLFSVESEKFTDFLKNEVVQFIDSNFRTTQERVIYGWEAAAYYLSELVLKENSIFNGVIITDGGLASEKTVEEFNSDKDTYLYISNSKRDIYYIASTEKFTEILKKHNPKNLIWKYELFNDEVHETMPHLAMYKGIKYYYHNYDALVFESIQQYIDMGGIPYIKSFLKERVKRFGNDDNIYESTQNSLIWLGLNRNNFKYFSFFMEEFKDVLDTKRYANAYWQNKFGQFYLTHKDYKNAIKYFNAGITKYPNTNFEAEMRHGLSIAKSMTN